MKFEEFIEMPIDKARAKVERLGLKALIKNTGEFYHGFFRWGLSSSDFKEKLKILVDHGLDLNQPLCEGWGEKKKAPIFQALLYSESETASVIKALVECGADINLQNDAGQTPIMAACRCSGNLSKPSVAKALIKAGADLSLKDSTGNLVTDLADAKALPILVAAGAPVDAKNKHALITAIKAKDLKLSQELLQRGLKKKLQGGECQSNLAFLETLAQSSPDLFLNGFSLEDTADKKAIRVFRSLLDMCRAEPINNSSNEIDEDALPPSLRDGRWPPAIFGKPPLSSKPSEHFPFECTAILERSALKLSPADKSRVKKVQDVADEYLSFPDFNIKKEQKEISSSIRKILKDKLKGKYIHKYNIDTEYDFLFKQIPWAIESDIDTLWNDLRDFIFDMFKSPHYDDSDVLAWIVSKLGEQAYSGILEWARQGDRLATHYLTRFDAARSAPLMAQFITDGRFTRNARYWFRRFPDAAAYGLLADLADGTSTSRLTSMAVLRWLASEGHRGRITSILAHSDPEFSSLVEATLAADRHADFLPKKMPALPSYFLAQMHPAPLLKQNSQALPVYAVEALARMMLVSNCYMQTPALTDVLEACEPASLEEFAVSAYEVWRKNGSKKADVGFLHALSYMGGDRSATLLSEHYKSEPFSAATEAAIDCLGCMGGSIALSGLQAIIKLSKYDKASQRARDVLNDVADERGLTADQLDDLAIPDLGLNADGAIHLTFGPRQFTGRISADLRIELFDATGKTLKALPKPLKNDDQVSAKRSASVWRELQRGVRGAGSYQLRRFEQAMLDKRVWDSATFNRVIIPHPLIGTMVRHLVWAVLENEGAALTLFRVAADGTALDVNGSALTFADAATVILPHPLLLGDEVKKWFQVFADSKLPQPFPQLARKWFVEGPETEKLIRARDGTKVPLGSLRGLKAKGWEFEEGGAGMVWSVFRSVDGARASIDVEPGWSLSGADYEDFGGDQAVKLDVSVSGSDPIAYSELVRDFLSLPVVQD